MLPLNRSVVLLAVVVLILLQEELLVDAVGCESDDGSTEPGEGVPVSVESAEAAGVSPSLTVSVTLSAMDWEQRGMDVGCNTLSLPGVVTGLLCIGEELLHGEAGDVWLLVPKLGEGGAEYSVCGKTEVNHARTRRCRTIGGVSTLWDTWWRLVDNFLVVVFVRRGARSLSFQASPLFGPCH